LKSTEKYQTVTTTGLKRITQSST